MNCSLLSDKSHTYYDFYQPFLKKKQQMQTISLDELTQID